MSLQDEILAIERSLWTGGADSYRRHLDDDCLVAFTGMAGVSSREEVAATAGAPGSWRDLSVDVEGMVQPTPEVAIVTYRASASRGGGERYRALVSSGYVARDGEWKLAFHQQTPLSD